MATPDLKRVKYIGSKDKNIVYGYMKRHQQIFPHNNPYFTIVQLIQDLCLLYFHQMLNTTILTDDEQIKLLEMVHNHTNSKYKHDWKLLFRGSRDGFTRDDSRKM